GHDTEEPIMSRAAQYIVIDDPNFLVGLGGNSSGQAGEVLWTEFDFQVPSNCYLNRPSILTWMLNLSLMKARFWKYSLTAIRFTTPHMETVGTNLCRRS